MESFGGISEGNLFYSLDSDLDLSGSRALGRDDEANASDPSVAGPVVEDYEIQYSEDDILGKGNFGVVYRGVCRGAVVAVKIPRRSLAVAKVEEFKKEIEVMSQIVHPRVVALLGAYFPKDLAQGDLKIVMELFGEDIETLLLDPKRRKSDKSTLYERVTWVKQMAEGMAWIHGSGCVHRDLKPSNILWDSKTNSVKVCDFGMSLLLPPGLSTTADPKGTPLYVAPELVTGGPTTHACDIYSFAITAYVFIAKARPYDDRQGLPDDIGEFLGVVVDGMRPWEDCPHGPRGKYECCKFCFPPPTECPSSLASMLQDCWRGEYVDRPTFEEVLGVMDYVLVDCAILSSRNGRKFWKRHFVDPASGVREEVPWHAFHKAFWADFADRDRGDADDREFFKCIKELFVTSSHRGDHVLLEKFGRVLGFLPPLERSKSWFRSVADLCRQPWFWGDTSARAAYKQLCSAPARSFLVRFSGQAPCFAISFKEKSGAILHRRLVREYGADEIQFENADVHKKAAQKFASLPHLVSIIAPLMKWNPCTGGPYWWIFHEKDDETKGGYTGYFQAIDEESLTSSSDSESSEEEPLPKAKKVTVNNLRALLRLRFLGRSGLVTELKPTKVQVLFVDNGRKEWVKKDRLLAKAYVLED